jgi:hypothetical protein
MAAWVPAVAIPSSRHFRTVRCRRSPAQSHGLKVGAGREHTDPASENERNRHGNTRIAGGSS